MAEISRVESLLDGIGYLLRRIAGSERRRYLNRTIPERSISFDKAGGQTEHGGKCRLYLPGDVLPLELSDPESLAAAGPGIDGIPLDYSGMDPVGDGESTDRAPLVGCVPGLLGGGEGLADPQEEWV